MTTVVSWNCNMAFRKKQEKILRYDPDIVVVQECENPEKKGDWSAFSDWVWTGENEHKGLGVFSRNGRTIESADIEPRSCRYFLPVTFSDGTSILGLWAMNDADNPRK